MSGLGGAAGPQKPWGPSPTPFFVAQPRRVVCVRRSLVRRFAQCFSQRASPESVVLAPARPVARSLRSLRPRPGPSAPRGGSLQGAGVLLVAGVSGPLPGRRALRARRPGTPETQSLAASNDPQMIRKNIRKSSVASLPTHQNIHAEFLSIAGNLNSHAASKTSSISCPQRCARFCGTSQMIRIIRKRSAFGLRHMPALRVGILMRQWPSSAPLLIKEWFSATRPARR